MSGHDIYIYRSDMNFPKYFLIMKFPKKQEISKVCLNFFPVLDANFLRRKYDL